MKVFMSGRFMLWPVVGTVISVMEAGLKWALFSSTIIQRASALVSTATLGEQAHKGVDTFCFQMKVMNHFFCFPAGRSETSGKRGREAAWGEAGIRSPN